VVAVLFSAGCGQSPTGTNPANSPSEATAKPVAAAGEHSGWWCAEHGVPEAECDAKVAEDCKAKGDWCEEHNRAESQCFVCDPKRADKFAALYEAKFGEKPPKRSE
jgi:hypothetical protein